MAEIVDHVVLKCSSRTCGLRYPSPVDDPRREKCPLCDAAVTSVASYPLAPQYRAAAPSQGELVAVLDNIRSALNVGTILRAADGAGLHHVYLGGVTASADNPKVIKTALGAHQSVDATSCRDATAQIESLRGQGYAVWAIEATTTSVPFSTIIARPQRLVFVVGNERAGIDPGILELCERVVHIPMQGEKSTLNVGVAFGIAAFALRDLPVS